MQAVMGSQILILQLATLALSFQLTARLTVDFSILRMSLFKYFKRVDISALLPDPKGQRIVVVVYIMSDDIASISPM